MGGSAERGNRTPYAEFNAWVDPDALEIVLASGVRFTMVGLHVTHQALATPQVIERIGQVGTPLARTCQEWLQFFAGTYRELFGMEPPLHDPCAMAIALDPTIAESVDTFVAAETQGRWTRGATVVDLKDRLRRDAQRPRRDEHRRRALLGADDRGDRRAGRVSSPEICVVGSVNLDIVVAVEPPPVPGETVLGGDRAELHGGKGANQAVAAARCGPSRGARRSSRATTTPASGCARAGGGGRRRDLADRRPGRAERRRADRRRPGGGEHDHRQPGRQRTRRRRRRRRGGTRFSAPRA